MRIAVYGGSFNPPHIVHAEVSMWLLSSELVDSVWLVPVYKHAFEGVHSKRLASFDSRVQWCQAMARDTDPRVLVSDVEAKLPVPSFTIDTLNHLAEQHPEHTFRLVVGADVLEQVGSWRDWAGIQARFEPIVVGREGHPVPNGSRVFPNVSSTRIRACIEAGQGVGDLVTPSVAALLEGGGDWWA